MLRRFALTALCLTLPAIALAGRFPGHHRRYGGPYRLDPKEAAYVELRAFVDHKLAEGRADLEICVDTSQDRGEPIPPKAITLFRLESGGLAHPVSLRLEGGVNSWLQDCLWREVNTWRGELGEGEAAELTLNLRLKPSKKGVEAAASASSPASASAAQVADRARGQVLLHAVAPEEAPAPLRETLEMYTPDLAFCFERAWELAGYDCSGPLLLPVSVDAGGAGVAGEPRWFQEGASTPAATPASPAPTLPPLAPRCPETVAPCLVRMVGVWQLPPQSAGASVTLQLMVQPPLRLEEVSVPASWGLPPASSGQRR